MKNKKIFLVVLALALVLGMAACDTGGGRSSGGGGGGGTSLAKATYNNVDKDGNIYELVITKAASKTVQYSQETDDVYVKKSLSTTSSVLAAYSPNTGDTYVLTIFLTNSTTKKSSGTVTVSGTTLTLKKGTSSFTVTVDKDSNKITTITAASGIPLDAGGTQAAPTMTNWSEIEIKGNLGDWTFGWDEDGIVTVYDQVWWELSEENLTKAQKDGTKLVLVFKNAPAFSFYFVWQAPDDPVWRWWEATVIHDEKGKVIPATGAKWDASKKTLTIPLNSTSLKNYDIFVKETKLRFLIACFRENGNGRLSIHHDLGIVSANIVE